MHINYTYLEKIGKKGAGEIGGEIGGGGKEMQAQVQTANVQFRNPHGRRFYGGGGGVMECVCSNR